ncbi:cation:proton antiporter [Kiritimatiellota bacterium B12222]|nr:cation:proton antiporter [Kiritimatiellota bacterium B12222]
MQDILLILGIGVFGGMMGAWLFQKLRIPQVIGYIAIGLIIGRSGLGIIGDVEIPALRPFSYLALAFIGFLVGGELEGKIFKQYGKQFIGIMLGEGLGAFFVVGAGTGLILWFITGSIPAALAGGIVFGAISSATDPASTVDVLWEYRSKGLLTTGLISVVALDDALALTLYALGTSVASLLVGGEINLNELLMTLGVELIGSGLIGVFCGFGLSLLVKHSRSSDRSLTLLVGCLLLIAGVCLKHKLDVILCAMAAGATLINASPHRSKPLLESLRAFASPIYVMFFVMVGARLQLTSQPAWLWGIVAFYVVGRTIGKYAGTWIGATTSKSPALLKNYLGLGLFAQGGVAVGLSMMAGQHLSGVEVLDGLDLGTVVVSAVTATTLLVQLIGPASVKWAITKTGEIGRNVTEEDIIKELKVADVMHTDPATIREGDLLTEVFNKFSNHDQLCFPVVNNDGACIGVISIDSLKSLFVEQEIWSWMLAGDVMVPIKDIVSVDAPLAEAMETMTQMEAEETILRNPQSRLPVGIFDLRSAKRSVSKKLLQRQGV